MAGVANLGQAAPGVGSGRVRVCIKTKPRERRTATERQREKRVELKDITGGPGTSRTEFRLHPASLVLMGQLRADPMVL